MDLFLQQVLSGLATGGIYACLALAVVMIYQAIDHFNFAQGEMAMFSTFIAWQLMAWGSPYWVAFFLTIVISFIGGVAIERIIFAPIKNAPVLSHIIVFIALFSAFNSIAGFIWDFTIKSFPSPFPERSLFDTTLIGMHDTGMIAVTLIMLALIYLFFRFTRVGLAMQAAAANPDSARLVGISVGWMLALGWGLAAAIGAICIRAKAIYFSFLTLAFQMILYSAILAAVPITGGDQGLMGGFPKPVFLGIDLAKASHMYMFCAGLAIISALVMRQIVESPCGYVLRMLRDNPDRAAFLGPFMARRQSCGAEVLAA